MKCPLESGSQELAELVVVAGAGGCLIASAVRSCLLTFPAWMCVCAILAVSGCSGGNSTSPKPPNPVDTAVESPQGESSKAPPKGVESVASAESSLGRVHFNSATPESGIEFVYQNGAQGQLLMVESLGGGAGWLDFDRDGLLDLYLCQGGDPAAANPLTRPNDCLYRQTETGLFELTTDVAQISEHEYGQGVAVGDYDNDGFQDIYVTNSGKNSFFSNCGDGTFEEIASELKIDNDHWSSSAAWGDLDLDGDLDLYVCNYLQYDAYHPFRCEKDGQPALCHPRQLPHWPDECYENLGDGTFQPNSQKWHLYGEGNKGLGVAIGDFTNDGWPDIYVANDTTPNFLFVSQQGKDFVESALRLGAALSGDGAMQASMGVGVADYDRNGMLDICLTHFTGESNTLYQNLGEFGFNDVSGLTGIHQATLSRLGFGIVMTDFDANGTMEMLVTNGHIDDRNADGDGYEQLPMLLTWSATKWLDDSAQAGDFFTHKRVGRAIARADYDNDGDDDVLVVHQNSPTELLRNESEEGHWLRLNFIGRRANRFGIGTRVEVIPEVSSAAEVEELVAGTSYCATHEAALPIALGKHSGKVTLKIHWPGGVVQEVAVEQIDRKLVLLEPKS